MANNKAIQILRGTEAGIEAHKEEILLDGQLLFKKKDNDTARGTLYIGQENVQIKDLKGTQIGLPITSDSDTHLILGTPSGSNITINGSEIRSHAKNSGYGYCSTTTFNTLGIELKNDFSYNKKLSIQPQQISITAKDQDPYPSFTLSAPSYIISNSSGNTISTDSINSIVGGISNTLTNASNCFAIGEKLNITDADYCGAFGYQNIINVQDDSIEPAEASNNAFIINKENTITNSPDAFCCGYKNQIKNGWASIAGGDSNIVNHGLSFAFGKGLITSDDISQIVLGKYNKENDDAYIVVGNGDGNDTNQRSNLVTLSDSQMCYYGNTINLNNKAEIVLNRTSSVDISGVYDASITNLYGDPHIPVIINNNTIGQNYIESQNLVVPGGTTISGGTITTSNITTNTINASNINTDGITISNNIKIKSNVSESISICDADGDGWLNFSKSNISNSSNSNKLRILFLNRNSKTVETLIFSI